MYPINVFKLLNYQLMVGLYAYFVDLDIPEVK